MNNQYNIWCKWHKLKTVVLGTCYPVNFFKDIKNDRIRSALTRITEETLEDLEYYEKVLKDFGCHILKPTIKPNLSIMDYMNTGKVQSIPRSPLQPRDWQFVLGNKLYCNGKDANGEFFPVFENYNKENFDLYENAETDLDYKISKEMFDVYKGTDWLEYDDYLKLDYFDRVSTHVKEEYCKLKRVFCLPLPASCTVVGRDLYIDIADGSISNTVLDYFRRTHSNIRVNTLAIGGHNDGCFHTLKPGAILSLRNIQYYDKTFPNWDVCYLENQSWSLVEPFVNFKKKVEGKWWVPGEENNDEFTSFVETWLNEWVGFCEESVFDVNVLMLDENHVCVSNYNEIAFAFFKKHKIEPIIVPWRHRYFWDGGLHCITLDLYREGGMEDYFPNRKEEIVDLGFN